jgi:hypothetical protein
MRARSALILLLLTTPLLGQGRPAARTSATADNPPYDGQFTFTRIRYGSGLGAGYGWRNSWNHDYPRADRHLSVLLDEMTTIGVQLRDTRVLTLEDQEIFRNPIIYLSEPGFWQMSDADVLNLRAYLLKGGFIIFDDFEAGQIQNLIAQMRRALPEHRLMEIDASHPIFNSFFDITEIYFPHPMVNVTPVYYGIFEENDPTRRMLAMINHNNDLAEFWEWSGEGLFPVDDTNEAYKLGINYIVYALTH